MISKHHVLGLIDTEGASSASVVVTVAWVIGSC